MWSLTTIDNSPRVILVSVTNYKNNELDGLHETWSKNGQLKSRTNYKNGELDGPYEVWYANGQLESRVNYKNRIITFNEISSRA